MGEGKAQRFQDPWSQFRGDIKSKDQWEVAKNEYCDRNNSVTCRSLSPSPSTSSLEDSTISNGSSYSLDTGDDASSSPPYSSLSNSTESLYDLSELMAHLPIKRGLSQFFHGKSESFTCLSRVTSVDDLKKKETPRTRKAKARKSYQSGLDAYKSFTLPKPIIAKKTPRASLFSSSPSRRTSSSRHRHSPAGHGW